MICAKLSTDKVKVVLAYLFIGVASVGIAAFVGLALVGLVMMTPVVFGMAGVLLLH